jgi:DNA-binding MarR family transcriptional regulator
MQLISKIFPKQSSPCHCMNVRRASRAVTQFYDEVLKPSGITIAQMGLLRHLELAAGTTIGELAKRLRIDRTTLNRNMKPLADAGLITVSPGRDSRTRQVLLTAAGKASVTEAWTLWGEAQASLREYLGEEDSARLVQLLAKLEALVP